MSERRRLIFGGFRGGMLLRNHTLSSVKGEIESSSLVDDIVIQHLAQSASIIEQPTGSVAPPAASAIQSCFVCLLSKTLFTTPAEIVFIDKTGHSITQ